MFDTLMNENRMLERISCLNGLNSKSIPWILFIMHGENRISNIFPSIFHWSRSLSTVIMLIYQINGAHSNISKIQYVDHVRYFLNRLQMIYK